jgi:hypothetical protein
MQEQRQIDAVDGPGLDMVYQQRNRVRYPVALVAVEAELGEKQPVSPVAAQQAPQSVSYHGQPLP